MTSPGMTPVPPIALAAADQATSAITDAAYRLVSDRLAEVGLSLDNLSDDEREVLSIGINCGAEATLTLRPIR